MGGPGPDIVPIAQEEFPAGHCSPLTANGVANGAHRFFRRPSTGAGDSCDPESDRRPQGSGDPLGESPSHGLADDPLPSDQIFRDPQHVGLHLVRIRHHAPQEIPGRARDIRHTLRDQASGATLGNGQGLAGAAASAAPTASARSPVGASYRYRERTGASRSSIFWRRDWASAGSPSALALRRRRTPT